MGAMLTTFPIDSMIRERRLPDLRFTTYGLILGGIGTVAALLPARPACTSEVPDRRIAPASTSGASPREMLRSPIFWLMFAMMTMMSTGGLVVTSNFAAFARDFKVADAIVLGVRGAAARAHLRPLHERFHAPLLRLGFGPDRARKHDGSGLRARGDAPSRCCSFFREEPVAVRVSVRASSSSAGARSSRLFPSTLTDTFGEKYATTNYGFLYIAQGIGSIVGGPVAALSARGDRKLGSCVRHRDRARRFSRRFSPFSF